jgi:putative ABC transport system substrate-binding protein
MAVSLSSMLGKVDLVFTANDVTVTAGFSAVVNFGIQHHIPVFAGDYSSVERGAIGAVGQNYFNVGLDAGVIVDSVLSGRSISSIPVVYTQGGDLYLNEFAAGQMGVTLSDEVLKKAKQVYHSISQQTER